MKNRYSTKNLANPLPSDLALESGYEQALQDAEVSELSRRAGLYPEMLAALNAAFNALAPPGSFGTAADRSYAIGDAYNSLKAVIAKCEKGEDEY